MLLRSAQSCLMSNTVPIRGLYGDLFVKPSHLLTSSVSDSRLLRFNTFGRSEGSLPSRATLAPRPCIRLDPCWIPTMKQPFASAARLRGDAPILLAALEPTVRPGQRHLGSSTAIRGNPSGRRTACSGFLADRLSGQHLRRVLVSGWIRAGSRP